MRVQRFKWNFHDVLFFYFIFIFLKGLYYHSHSREPCCILLTRNPYLHIITFFINEWATVILSQKMCHTWACIFLFSQVFAIFELESIILLFFWVLQTLHQAALYVCVRVYMSEYDCVCVRVYMSVCMSEHENNCQQGVLFHQSLQTGLVFNWNPEMSVFNFKCIRYTLDMLTSWT